MRFTTLPTTAIVYRCDFGSKGIKTLYFTEHFEDKDFSVYVIEYILLSLVGY